MREIGQHLMLRLRDDRVIAATVAARRRLAQVVLRVASPWIMLAFRAVDTHMHLEACCSRPQAGELARRVEIALQRSLRLEVGFAPPNFERVRDQHHLRRAFTYVLDQARRHDYRDDPLHDASNLPDLLGMRITGSYTVRHVLSQLPRTQRADLLPILGVKELAPATDGPLELLADAAAAAVGLADIAGRSALQNAARRAAVHAATGRRTTRELAQALNVDARAVRRLRTRPAVAALVRAVGLQWRMRAMVADAGLLTAV